MPSSTVENYLKAILHLDTDEQARVAVGRIAGELQLTPGTVTTMMKHLAREKFIDYLPRKGVKLTEKGRRTALEVLRRHRLTELFLVEVMKLDWSCVHEEAEVLEHVLSDRLVERIDEMLGRPAHDPHGDPIPDAAGVVAEDRARALADCPAGSYRLVRVSRDEPEFLLWLQERGLRPGVAIEVEDRDALGGVVIVRVAGSDQSVTIGERAAQALQVA